MRYTLFLPTHSAAPHSLTRRRKSAFGRKPAKKSFGRIGQHRPEPLFFSAAGFPENESFANPKEEEKITRVSI
jgi:hypothetical protein